MPRRSELTELPPVTKPQRGIPWDEIADGTIWELVQGEDFKGKPEGVEARIRAKAKAMGRSVETRVQEQPGRNKPPMILVQFDAPQAGA
jgi:hypothetical protein